MPGAEISSWTSVGWIVALLIGLWGAFLGTGDFRTAIEMIILTGLILALKFATVCLGRKPQRRLLVVLGEIAVIGAVVWVSHWTHAKQVQAKADKEQRDEQSRTIAQLRQETAAFHADMTGGSAYPEIIPQSYVAPLRFKIFNRGSSPLQNISVSIRHSSKPYEHSGPVFLGTIAVGADQDLPFPIAPSISSDSSFDGERQFDSWFIDINASNGMFEQLYDFRPTKDCEAVWEARSTYLWKRNQPTKVINRDTKFGSINLTNVCHTAPPS